MGAAVKDENGSDRVSLTQEAYRVLKREILENRLQPGFQALEPEIATRLGMSRTPVREAVVRLQDEGLVEIVPRRGIRVLPLSPADMREIYQVLAALESDACALLANRKPSEQELEPLFRETAAMEVAYARGDRETWARADDRFHRELVTLCENRRLASIVNMLLDQAHRMVMFALYLRDFPARSTADHRLILKMIMDGVPHAASHYLRQHREWGAGELLRILERHNLHHI